MFKVQCYSIKEVARLYYKAASFVHEKNASSSRLDFYPCKVFYRTQTLSYFHDLEENHGNVMRPYIKDSNGDIRSPINGRIKGLFFSAAINWNTLAPKQSSPYGTRRLLVETNALINDDMRLYFADFYCRTVGPRYGHHVTLVFTRRSSRTDQFCEKYLQELDKIENIFLRIRSPGEVEVTGSGIWVEILYTENVNISTLKREGLARFINVSCSNVRAGVQPKKTYCSVCNI